MHIVTLYSLHTHTHMHTQGTFQVDDEGLSEQGKLTKTSAMLNLSQDELTGMDLVQGTARGSEVRLVVVHCTQLF